MILAKKGTTIIEVKPEKFDRNERGKVFEIIKACFEVICNSPGRDMNMSEIFETEMKNVSICGISTLHIKSRIARTYNTENGEKKLETIEIGTSKL